jgi:hypothetical protein
MRHRAATAAVLLFAASATGAATAADAAGPPPKTGFTVVTSFVGASAIIEADGPWSDCTSVTDLTNYVNQVGPTTVRYSGEKQVDCQSGSVVIHYTADQRVTSQRGKTFGSWEVQTSTHPGIHGGAGTVMGDPRGCPDCIVDVFEGRVY